MKYFKYIFGTLALIVVGFLLFGLLKPDLTYECEIIVDKPLAESWQVSQDIEKMPEWLDGFQKIEHISGTVGTVGSISDVHFISDGQEMIIRETITNIVPNESISMLFETDFMNMNYTISMTSEGDKTKIVSTTTTIGNGIISKSIIALIGSSIKSQEDTNLLNLKKTIENNSKNYFPFEN